MRVTFAFALMGIFSIVLGIGVGSVSSHAAEQLFGRVSVALNHIER
ncbi:MAG: hypothetical protein Q7N87_01825 [Candidatus Uhrbacteria bacterium]|nr:hypothetical protein [Candidatus Uhrbacteria bacterium]